MKKLVIGLVVVFCLLLVTSMVVAGIVWSRGQKVEQRTWLELDLDRPLIEYLPEDAFAALLHRDQPRLKDVVDALDRAATDQRVEGLLVRFGSTPLPMATAQELRGAIERFRAGDKQTVAWADTFGEWTGANATYFLASACETVALQPSGDVNLTGLMIASPFLAGTLEKLDIETQLDHRHEYKNAMNLFTERQYTEAHEEAVTAVMESIFEQLVAGVASGRGLSATDVRARIDQGVFLGQEAVEAGLVDELIYGDDLLERIEGDDEEGTEVKFLSPTAYLRRAQEEKEGGTRVALVYGVGQVVRGESSVDPLSGTVTMGSESVGEALEAAIEDDDVQAILFRVDSPGGSYVASDTIWHQTVEAREADKPIVVSMGTVAGSGGYFVAMDAARIVAHPATITGSIGVLGGKLIDRGFWHKLGITFDEVHVGENATMYSSLTRYTESEYARFQASLDRIYADFTQKVAAGRELPLERVREIARGRIWTGEDALDLGLVDGLGGYHEALVAVREELELPPDAPLDVQIYPRPRSAFELLMERFGGASASTRLVARLLQELRPVVELARQVGLVERPGGVLEMPYVPQPAASP